MTKDKQEPLKVGFDLDGVLLFNPLNVTRPLLKAIRQKILKKENAGSFVPKTPFEIFTNYLYIKSSMFVAKGVETVRDLVENKVILAYIITARNSSLKGIYEKAIAGLNSNGHFSGCYYNSDDLEPYEFKKKMISNLDLDIYIDDNWDVVQKLNGQTGAAIFWVSNIVDSHIQYKYKYSNLKKALAGIEKFRSTKTF